MYTPRYTAEGNLSKLHSLIDDYSFGTLICQGAGGRLEITHVPFVLDKQRGPHGTLLSHVARANPIWHVFENAQQVVVIFQGPHGYISPSWYTSRLEVPTWNYAVVHAYGTPRLLAGDDLTALLAQMVGKYEQGNLNPWGLDDLPAEMLAEMEAEIVGFELEIARLEGKFKLSQNRSLQDRQGAIAGVSRRGGVLDIGLARLMRGALEESE